MTLVEFLLARIAEDEAGARFLEQRDRDPGRRDLWFGRPIVSHLLAECEAKRRIVERLVDLGAHLAETGRQMPDMPSALLVDGILADLALPYADHPSYDEAWRP